MKVEELKLHPKTEFYTETYEHLGLTNGTMQCVYIPGHIADDLGRIELQHLTNQLQGCPLVVAGPSHHHAGRIFYCER